MADMRRFPTVLALLVLPGCMVGPQEDLYDTAADPADQRNDGADSGAGAEADGDADEDPPIDEAAYPDDGADFADTDDDHGGEGEDPSGASVEDLEGAPVPGVPPVPRPGLPSPRSGGPDLDASDYPANLGATDGPSDEGKS